jgi:hypothetical protein
MPLVFDVDLMKFILALPLFLSKREQKPANIFFCIRHFFTTLGKNQPKISLKAECKACGEEKE